MGWALPMAFNVRTMVLASLIGLSAGIALAQSGGKGPGAASDSPGATAAASSPNARMGMGMGTGMGPGGGRGAARWGSDYTPGWMLMNPQERKAHQDRMHATKTHGECKSYQDQHHEQMVARAKERGGQALAHPRRDACGGLKK